MRRDLLQLWRALAAPAIALAAPAITLAALTVALPARAQDQHRTWLDFGGSLDQSRFVDFDQITKDNVGKLEVVWTYAPNDDRIYQFSPVIVDDVVYVLADDNSLVALDARTGAPIWKQPGFAGITRRGINYWQSADGRDRRLLVTRNNRIEALDATTGEAITSFGTDGFVDLRVGLGRDPDSVRRVQASSPGSVFENLVIVGSSPGEGLFSAPGHIRAYDVVTGALVWTFHTIPQPGEFGYDTWPEDAWRYVGGVNAWGEISIDGERGIAYVPLGSPTYDYYGADRIGANLFGNSLVALDARTGERLWHFQTVHHDLWDYDLTAAPQLLTVDHDGRRVDVVAQATKQGFVFVFDRVTGEPLWPIEERPVPPSPVPGEEAWPTQPFPTGLPTTARQIMRPDDVSGLFLTPEELTAWRARVDAARTGLYTPIGLEETVAVPGAVGGTNWGNTAANPDAGIVYVLNQDFPSFYQLEEVPAAVATPPAPALGGRAPALGGRAPALSNRENAALVRAGSGAYTTHCEVCHGDDRTGTTIGPALTDIQISYEELSLIIANGQGRMPPLAHLEDNAIRGLAAFLSGGTPSNARPPPAYPEGVDAPAQQFTTGYGLSHPHIMQPPWSQIMAIDLNAGRMLWKVPLGQDAEATKRGADGTGVPRGAQRSGMIVTATGLVFSTAKDGKVYAFDADNGTVLWAGSLPMGTEGLPAMYIVDGRQYLIVNATTPLTWGPRSREGGIDSDLPTGVGGYVVFALPEALQ
jgi:quinoprotein glucose dehydrogenase